MIQYQEPNGKMSFGTILLVLCMISCLSSVINSIFCGNIKDKKGQSICGNINSGICCIACLYILAFKTR